MPFTPAETKGAVIERLNAILGTDARLGEGSSIPEELITKANDLFGLPNNGSMPVRAQALVESAGFEWSGSFDSRGTPSRGGSTITREGMNRLLEAVESVAGDAPEALAPSLGRAYAISTGSVTASPSVLLRDWSALDESTQAHAELENSLAAEVAAAGLVPLSPGPGDPAFDLAWMREHTFVAVEVKSITPMNHRQQVRLGLGQVLEYRTVLRSRGIEAQAVLAISGIASPLDSAMADEVDVVLLDSSMSLGSAGLL